MTFSPDGALLASGSADATIQLWDVGLGEPIATLRGHEDAVTAVVFSPDGARLASGSSDRTIRIWDPVAREQLAALIGHQREIAGVSFSADGQRLVSISLGRAIRTWDSVPTADRFQQRLQAQRSAGVARSMVDGLFAQGLGSGQIIARLQKDRTLNEPTRRAALNELLQRIHQARHPRRAY